jgi:hypothetical protein
MTFLTNDAGVFGYAQVSTWSAVTDGPRVLVRFAATVDATANAASRAATTELSTIGRKKTRQVYPPFEPDA